jgi:hypothetical protein
MSFAEKCMELDIITLSKMSHDQKDNCGRCMFLLCAKPKKLHDMIIKGNCWGGEPVGGAKERVRKVDTLKGHIYV